MVNTINNTINDNGNNKVNKSLNEINDIKNVKESDTYKEMKKFFSSKPIVRLDDVIELILRKSNKEDIKEDDDNEEEGEKGEENKISFKDENNFNYVIVVDKNEIKFNLGINDTEFNLPLFSCPATGYKFFYFSLPAKLIHNDIELQPRPLEFKRLWELYKHLLYNSQLTPSVCRLVDNKIYLFDGQHKAAAQIWAGRKEIECKVYINPSVKVLKETNLIAHDKLRQMPFFTSVLIKKWASIFSEEWNEYLDSVGEKSEAGFVSFLTKKNKKKNEALNMIESNIYESILEDKTNKIKKFTDIFGNNYGSETKKLITINRLKQSFFKKFIATPPLLISLEESDRLRELERLNTIKLLNLITKYSLDYQFAETTSNIKKQDFILKSEKIFLNGAFKAVCAIIKDTIATILELYDETDRNEIFLRVITEEKWKLIETSIETIFSHRIWDDNSQQNYNNLRINNENTVRKYLSQRGLSVNWILNYTFDTGNNFID